MVCPAGSVSGRSIQVVRMGWQAGWFGYSPSVGQQVGEAVQRNAVIGGSVILLTFQSLLYYQEAVGKSFPKTASPTHLSFPIVRPR